jgi:hypothetical protein
MRAPRLAVTETTRDHRDDAENFCLLIVFKRKHLQMGRSMSATQGHRLSGNDPLFPSLPIRPRAARIRLIHPSIAADAATEWLQRWSTSEVTRQRKP